MNVVECDKSGIQNLLHSWHKKKNIKCPTCKASIFLFDGITPCFSSVRIINEIVQIHHSPCQSSIGNCGKALFFCLSCGSQSSHTLGRLQDRGCKCVGVYNNKSKKSHSKKQQRNVWWAIMIMSYMKLTILMSQLQNNGGTQKLIPQWVKQWT